MLSRSTYLSTGRLSESLKQIAQPVQLKRHTTLASNFSVHDWTCSGINSPTGHQIINKAHPDNIRYQK
jgi:hypothetical protein